VSSPHPSRRAVITGGSAVGTALLVAAASGCGASSSADGQATVGDPTAPAVDADSDLVETVGAQLTAALSLAGATASSVPQVRPLAQRFTTLHRAHLRELSRPHDAGEGRVKGSAETARARLLRAEEKLQGQLVKASLAAESGALAQVFASMAAAVAQARSVAA
jgi:hypothetical protein